MQRVFLLLTFQLAVAVAVHSRDPVSHVSPVSRSAKKPFLPHDPNSFEGCRAPPVSLAHESQHTAATADEVVTQRRASSVSEASKCADDMVELVDIPFAQDVATTCCPINSLECAGCASYDSAKGQCTKCLPGFVKQCRSWDPECKQPLCTKCQDVPNFADRAGRTCNSHCPLAKGLTATQATADAMHGVSLLDACCACGGGKKEAMPLVYRHLANPAAGTPIRAVPMVRAAPMYAVDGDCNLAQVGLALDGRTGEVTGTIAATSELVEVVCKVTALQDTEQELQASAVLKFSVGGLSYSAEKVIVFDAERATIKPTESADRAHSNYRMTCNPALPWLTIDAATGAITSTAHSADKSVGKVVGDLDPLEPLQFGATRSLLAELQKAATENANAEAKPAEGEGQAKEGAAAAAQGKQEGGDAKLATGDHLNMASLTSGICRVTATVTSTGRPDTYDLWAIAGDPWDKILYPGFPDNTVTLTLGQPVPLSGQKPQPYAPEANNAYDATRQADRLPPVFFTTVCKEAGADGKATGPIITEHDQTSGRVVHKATGVALFSLDPATGSIGGLTETGPGAASLPLKLDAASGRASFTVLCHVWGRTMSSDRANQAAGWVRTSAPLKLVVQEDTCWAQVPDTFILVARADGGAASADACRQQCSSIVDCGAFAYSNNVCNIVRRQALNPSTAPTAPTFTSAYVRVDQCSALTTCLDIAVVGQDWLSGHYCPVMQDNWPGLPVPTVLYMVRTEREKTSLFYQRWVPEREADPTRCPAGTTWVVRRGAGNGVDRIRPKADGDKGRVEELRGAIEACQTAEGSFTLGLPGADQTTTNFAKGLGPAGCVSPYLQLEAEEKKRQEEADKGGKKGKDAGAKKDEAVQGKQSEGDKVDGPALSMVVSFESESASKAGDPEYWLHPCECIPAAWGRLPPVSEAQAKLLPPSGDVKIAKPGGVLIAKGNVACPADKLLSVSREAMTETDCREQCEDNQVCTLYLFSQSDADRVCRLYSECPWLHVEPVMFAGPQVESALYGLPKYEVCVVANPEQCMDYTKRREYYAGTPSRLDYELPFESLLLQCDRLAMIGQYAVQACGSPTYAPAASLKPKQPAAVFTPGTRLRVGCWDERYVPVDRRSLKPKPDEDPFTVTCIDGRWIDPYGAVGFQNFECAACVQVAQPELKVAQAQGRDAQYYSRGMAVQVRVSMSDKANLCLAYARGDHRVMLRECEDVEPDSRGQAVFRAGYSDVWMAPFAPAGDRQVLLASRDGRCLRFGKGRTMDALLQPCDPSDDGQLIDTAALALSINRDMRGEGRGGGILLTTKTASQKVRDLALLCDAGQYLAAFTITDVDVAKAQVSSSIDCRPLPDYGFSYPPSADVPLASVSQPTARAYTVFEVANTNGAEHPTCPGGSGMLGWLATRTGNVTSFNARCLGGLATNACSVSSSLQFFPTPNAWWYGSFPLNVTATCSAGQVLSGWWFANSADGTNTRLEWSCCDLEARLAPATLVTTTTTPPNGYPQLAGRKTGAAQAVANHPVSCPVSAVLTSLKFDFNAYGANSGMSLTYGCKVSSHDDDSTYTTACADVDDEPLFVLDRHVASCPPGTFMSSWKLDRDTCDDDQMRVVYKCSATQSPGSEQGMCRNLRTRRLPLVGSSFAATCKEGEGLTRVVFRSNVRQWRMWLEWSCCSGIQNTPIFPVPTVLSSTNVQLQELETAGEQSALLAQLVVSCPQLNTALSRVEMKAREDGSSYGYDYTCSFLPGVFGDPIEQLSDCVDLSSDGHVELLQTYQPSCPIGSALAYWRLSPADCPANSYRMAYGCRQSTAVGMSDLIYNKLMDVGDDTRTLALLSAPAGTISCREGKVLVGLQMNFVATALNYAYQYSCADVGGLAVSVVPVGRMTFENPTKVGGVVAELADTQSWEGVYCPAGLDSMDRVRMLQSSALASAGIRRWRQSTGAAAAFALAAPAQPSWLVWNKDSGSWCVSPNAQGTGTANCVRADVLVPQQIQAAAPFYAWPVSDIIAAPMATPPPAASAPPVSKAAAKLRAEADPTEPPAPTPAPKPELAELEEVDLTGSYEEGCREPYGKRDCEDTPGAKNMANFLQCFQKSQEQSKKMDAADFHTEVIDRTLDLAFTPFIEFCGAMPDVVIAPFGAGAKVDIGGPCEHILNLVLAAIKMGVEVPFMNIKRQLELETFGEDWCDPVSSGLTNMYCGLQCLENEIRSGDQVLVDMIKDVFAKSKDNTKALIEYYVNEQSNQFTYLSKALAKQNILTTEGKIIDQMLAAMSKKVKLSLLSSKSVSSCLDRRAAAPSAASPMTNLEALTKAGTSLEQLGSDVASTLDSLGPLIAALRSAVAAPTHKVSRYQRPAVPLTQALADGFAKQLEAISHSVDAMLKQSLADVKAATALATESSEHSAHGLAAAVALVECAREELASQVEKQVAPLALAIGDIIKGAARAPVPVGGGADPRLVELEAEYRQLVAHLRVVHEDRDAMHKSMSSRLAAAQTSLKPGFRDALDSAGRSQATAGSSLWAHLSELQSVDFAAETAALLDAPVKAAPASSGLHQLERLVAGVSDIFEDQHAAFAKALAATAAHHEVEKALTDAMEAYVNCQGGVALAQRALDNPALTPGWAELESAREAAKHSRFELLATWSGLFRSGATRLAKVARLAATGRMYEQLAALDALRLAHLAAERPAQFRSALELAAPSLSAGLASGECSALLQPEGVRSVQQLIAAAVQHKNSGVTHLSNQVSEMTRQMSAAHYWIGVLSASERGKLADRDPLFDSSLVLTQDEISDANELMGGMDSLLKDLSLRLSAASDAHSSNTHLAALMFRTVLDSALPAMCPAPEHCEATLPCDSGKHQKGAAGKLVFISFLGEQPAAEAGESAAACSKSGWFLLSRQPGGLVVARDADTLLRVALREEKGWVSRSKTSSSRLATCAAEASESAKPPAALVCGGKGSSEERCAKMAGEGGLVVMVDVSPVRTGMQVAFGRPQSAV